MKFHDPRQNCPPPSSHVIQLTGTIFELNSRIKETNVLSKFYENWAKNVTSTHYYQLTNHLKIVIRIQRSPVDNEKNALPTGGHVFSLIPTIFKLVRDINKTNVLTNFHDDWDKMDNCHYIHIEKNTPPTGGHAKIVTSRVFTRQTALLTGGHVFQRIRTTFELNQDIIKTNILTNFELGRDFIGTKLLTKFHEDGTRKLASRVFTSKC
ncbi:hypothetical protein DPMN_189905 [Dreissena polymorpha]|uniref:Uncharacterized protein n=1 Tax=Dreissena polymorpha TaxID=45954 RepID=A0A9D4IB90_DREPO|nr:hypothetical protein DPMN_189905 [Dreissena polymorpha]